MLQKDERVTKRNFLLKYFHLKKCHIKTGINFCYALFWLFQTNLFFKKATQSKWSGPNKFPNRLEIEIWLKSPIFYEDTWTIKHGDNLASCDLYFLRSPLIFRLSIIILLRPYLYKITLHARLFKENCIQQFLSNNRKNKETFFILIFSPFHVALHITCFMLHFLFTVFTMQITLCNILWPQCCRKKSWYPPLFLILSRTFTIIMKPLSSSLLSNFSRIASWVQLIKKRVSRCKLLLNLHVPR